jgi:hypothetical protein
MEHWTRRLPSTDCRSDWIGKLWGARVIRSHCILQLQQSPAPFEGTVSSSASGNARRRLPACTCLATRDNVALQGNLSVERAVEPPTYVSVYLLFCICCFILSFRATAMRGGDETRRWRHRWHESRLTAEQHNT